MITQKKLMTVVCLYIAFGIFTFLYLGGMR